MNTQNQQLLRIDAKELVQQTRKFLQGLTSTSNPVGVVLKTENDNQNYNYVVAYEQDEFIIVMPNGTDETAKLYGNWDEALICIQRAVNGQENAAQKTQIVLTQYSKNVD
ncbi:MAG TPA: hypothetical protein VE090_03140 [Methylomirabilota bacterium]|nr:hypothetical protein [Methylomirabilota bacterium]